MAKKPGNRSKLKKPQTAGQAPVAAATAAGPVRLALGLAFVIVATAAALVLVLEHIGGLSLPGCGPGGPCEAAAKSVWGKVPVVQWPVSFLGLAYFCGALVAWMLARGALPGIFRWLVRLGALGSAFFSAIIVVEWLVCPYCLVSHAGNFGFWITMETVRARTRRTAATVFGFAAVWLLTSVATGVWDWQVRQGVARRAEQDRAQAVQEMIKRGQDAPPATGPAEPPGDARPAATGPAAPPASAPDRPPFTGRYRHGPEAAPIRIVMITDYQCRDCRRLELEVFKVLERRPDISLSIKHFPFDTSCNPSVGRSLHPNACWAARAAEAAGMLWGSEGFFKVHRWLFERSGVFRTTQELEDGVRAQGYDPTGFVATMQREDVLARIQADIREAQELGLFFTPMIFINGVELKGWHAPQALTRTIDELTAARLPALTAAADHPPAALDKYVEDWRDWQPLYVQGPFKLPADTRAWTLGPADAAVRIVLWGDYQEPGTVEADAIIRDFVGRHSNASYTFRHCPFNSDCNPSLPYQRHPLACVASRAAEAAGELGGNDAYWKMHAWLMTNADRPWQQAAAQVNIGVADLRQAIGAMTAEERQKAAAKAGFEAAAVLGTLEKAFGEALTAAAGEMGLDAGKLRAAMASEAVAAAISEDVAAGKGLPVLRWGTSAGLHGIPGVFINDRYVPRWRLEDQVVLDRILEAAARP